MADGILNYTIGEILTTVDSALLWESIRQLQTESIIVKSVREEINKYVEENFDTETPEPENITKVYLSDYESCTWGGSWRNITYGDVSTYTYPNALCCYEEKQRGVYHSPRNLKFRKRKKTATLSRPSEYISLCHDHSWTFMSH